MRGAHGSDLSDLSVLHDCYSLRAHSAQSGTTSRTPSYTDRILLHAMPDRAGRAYIRAYDSCADITGSDHRPVTARIEVLVDRTVHGFNHRALTTNNSQSTVSEDTDNSELAAPTATARTSSTITSANVSDLEPGKAPESSREGSNTSAVGGALQSVQQSQHSARVQRILTHLQGGGPSQPPHLGKSVSQMENGPIEPYEGPLAIWRVELRDLSFNCMGSTQVDCPEIDEVLCLFPLPVEDPLARDRKTVALGEVRADTTTSTHRGHCERACLCLPSSVCRHVWRLRAVLRAPAALEEVERGGRQQPPQRVDPERPPHRLPRYRVRGLLRRQLHRGAEVLSPHAYQVFGRPGEESDPTKPTHSLL